MILTSETRSVSMVICNISRVTILTLRGESFMTDAVKMIFWNGSTDRPHYDYLDIEAAKQVHRFHESFPQYAPTPLASLDGLAETLGVSKIYVKDESYRFGLNAFKVLGGSYALGQVIAERLGMAPDAVDYSRIVSQETKDQLGEVTFVTTTDGNHGRGIAWTAAALGQKSVVYMPKGSSAERLRNIQLEGAEAEITDMNYDDAVRYAEEMAKKHGWSLVQDTAWEGYEQIPVWIMQGYMTMAFEAYNQLIEKGEPRPTHIFLQAGVGSMAAAVDGFFANMYGADRPITVIMEPKEADCFYRTVAADDGTLHAVGGDMRTIMAGLACGEPNPLGWEVLKDSADAFASCEDAVAAKGMRILGNPVGSDPRVISGESGAVGAGLLAELMTNEALREFREKLKLDSTSRVLMFSTEGDTDQNGYRSVVWDGAYPSR